jgi:hypothetical protein
MHNFLTKCPALDTKRGVLVFDRPAAGGMRWRLSDRNNGVSGERGDRRRAADSID